MKYEMHGMKHTPEYRIWKSMKHRCTKGSKDRAKYWDRGIKVCDEWSKSFLAFYRHIGSRPSPRHQIDRIDNDGNYEPGNVRWATVSQQARNRRKRLSKYDRYRLQIQLWRNEGMSMREIGRRLGTDHRTIGRLLA